MTAPLLEIRGLAVDIPTERGLAQILTGVDFALARGESLGIVGESGSGKSMTALAIMGLLPLRARVRGSILLDGTDLLQSSEPELCRVRGRRIAMVFQEPMTALNPVMPIGRQVAEGIELHLGVARAEAEARAARLLDRVGMPPSRVSPATHPHRLSGGQRQRVMIAIALACGPELLIADEPTTALDVTTQAQILDLIAGLADETGMALILISHDLGIVAETTARAMVMYAGGVVETAPTGELFAHMAHPYSRGLLAASPHAALALAESGRLAAIPGRVPDPAALPPSCPFAERCGHVQADCRAARPPLDPLEPGHFAACYHPVIDTVPA